MQKIQLLSITAIFIAIVFASDAVNAQTDIPAIEMVSVEGNAYVKSFDIGKYEVTQGQWKAVMGSNPSHFQSGDNYPVEMVSWDDIQEFISKLNDATGKNYRLPTMDEWDYASRGGNKSGGHRFSGSNEIENVAWYSVNSGGKTHPAGTKAPNELGIYDMNGNVFEWCEDVLPSRDSRGRAIEVRLVRGGGWSSVPAYADLSTNPNYWQSTMRFNNLGFRLVHQ